MNRLWTLDKLQKHLTHWGFSAHPCFTYVMQRISTRVAESLTKRDRSRTQCAAPHTASTQTALNQAGTWALPLIIGGLKSQFEGDNIIRLHSDGLGRSSPPVICFPSVGVQSEDIFRKCQRTTGGEYKSTFFFSTFVIEWFKVEHFSGSIVSLESCVYIKCYNTPSSK